MSRKVLGAAAVLTLMGLTGGGLTWQHHQKVRSPAYTLIEIQDAVASQSRLRFERFVDVDALASTAIDEIFAKATLQSVRESTSGFGVIGTLLGAQTADALRPAITQELKASLLRAVETGGLDRMFAEAEPEAEADDDERQLDLALIALNTTSDQMRFVGLGDIVQEEDVATVGVRFENALLDTTLVLRLRMERNDDRWKVTRPDNLSDYLDNVRRLQERHLADENAAVRGRIAALLEVGPLRRSVEQPYYSEFVRLRANLKNVGTERVDSIFLHTYHDGEQVHRTAGALMHVGGLDPGESATAGGLFEYNRYIDEHRTLRYNDNLAVEVWLLSVLPEDGPRELLGEYLSWSDYTHRRPR